MPQSSPPTLIAPDDLRRRTETDDGGFTLGIAADGDSHGSLLVFGSVSIRPGAAAVSWEADEKTYEAYQVQEGSLKVSWSGSGSGEAMVRPGEFFYFAPAHRYTIENAGDDEVVFVWALTPRMPGSEG